MDLNTKEIIISEGKKPLWKNIIAAFLFTLTGFLLIMFIKTMYYNHESIKNIKGSIAFLKLSILTLTGAINFSKVKTIYINLEQEKLKTQYSIGPFNIKYFSEIPSLEYVSVFKKGEDNVIEVNLWYKGNKHFNVFNYNNIDEAMDFGLLFSNKLNIDLLDATEKGNFKWVDKTIL